MIKRVVLDKADRLYHFPFDLEDFFPKRAIKSSEKRIPTIDLGRFRWPIEESEFSAEYHDYRNATDAELSDLKEAVSEWLMKEHKVKADPRKEIYLGQGIHRIIFDFCLAYVEYGDIVLCPEPGMPFYRRYVISVGGVPVTYTISGRTGYKPSFARLPANLGKSAKVLFLNSPNNPFGTALDDTELAHLVRMASRQNIFMINDAAYCSLADEKHIPIRSVPGGGKVGLEIFSVPFTFGLPYIPFGFAVGPPEVISGLETIGKTVGIVIPGNWVESD
jgi:aspartate/methionine/tyrosine aminotransferase